MQTDLNAYLQQYAQTWRNPNLVARSTMGSQQPPTMGMPNLAASQTGAQPGAGLPPPQGAQQGMPAQAPAAPIGPQQEEAYRGGDQSFMKLFKEQPEEEQTRQIDELEKQVGDINRAYEQMSQQLGQRPSTKLSRKEKGLLLMEFGLQLMSQSSGSRHGGDIGGAIGDAGMGTLESYRNLKAGKRQQAEKWDQDQMNLRAGRAKEVATATKDYRTGEREERRVVAAEASAENTGRRLDQQDRRLDQQEREINLRAENTGGYGRSGFGSDRDPARVATIKFMEGRGIPFEVAVRITGSAAQNPDPRKTYQDVYEEARRRYSTDEQAQQEAQMVVDYLYGPNAIQGRQQPLVQEEQPGQQVMRSTSKSGKPIFSRDGGKNWEYED